MMWLFRVCNGIETLAEVSDTVATSDAHGKISTRPRQPWARKIEGGGAALSQSPEDARSAALEKSRQSWSEQHPARKCENPLAEMVA